MTNNTIANVPRELLERVTKYCVSAPDAIKARNEVRDLLSAPSPAGMDGLKRYEVFPYLDDEVAEIDICEADDGSFVKYDDAQAIIDGLRGDLKHNDRARMNQFETIGSLHDELDQQAQRIGELEGLLRDCYPGCGLTARQTQSIRERIDAALAAGKEGE